MERRRSRGWSGTQLAGARTLLLAIAACGLVWATSSAAAPDGGAVTIRVVHGAGGKGAFVVEGAVADSGQAATRRSLARGHLHLVETLRGSAGTIVLRVAQTCGRKASTWRVASASGAYAGLGGAGTGSSLPCGTARTRLRVVYTGLFRTPPPKAPAAAPGGYGGWSSQNERLTLDVLPDGRRLTNVRLERLEATCSAAPAVSVEPAFLGTYAISDDGSFSIASGGSTIAGRFSGSQVQGTISYDTADGGSGPCSSGSVSWAASSPPPALPVAKAGSYCGSTAQNVGVCLGVTAGGSVARLRLEVVLECVQPDTMSFESAIDVGGAIPLRSNLTFAVEGSLGDSASGDYTLRGAFDEAGAAAGTLVLQHVTYDLDGTTFTCKDAAVRWKASRLGP